MNPNPETYDFRQSVDELFPRAIKCSMGGRRLGDRATQTVHFL